MCLYQIAELYNLNFLDNKLDKIPEYGVYRNLPADFVKLVVEWMISEHYILRTKGKYPVLHSTYEGLHYSQFTTEEKLNQLREYIEESKIALNQTLL